MIRRMLLVIYIRYHRPIKKYKQPGDMLLYLLSMKGKGATLIHPNNTLSQLFYQHPY